MTHVFKCKMCGGVLEVKPGDTVCECEYCGAVQTLPRLDSDKKANLYDRASYLRRSNDFDRAMGVYEQILSEDTTDAEAYWSLVLCRYGIEYVEDPATHKRIPTVNRAQFTSVFSDEDYQSAIRYADEEQRKVYEAEAKAIDDIQKGILEISMKEDPFDIFICYKETDDNGRRTIDSVLAYDLYQKLTEEGYKVFFSRVTLEDKVGIAYEPYIFAALNSAKIMLAVGTRPEYFNAVWVKNEWSRYLALIRKGAKKTLIPLYKDMNPYDLPEEFSHLQAQDMGRLGYQQDLIRGIHKILDDKKPKAASKETVIVNSAQGVALDNLVKRAYVALEDGNWDRASEFCDQILNHDPDNAQAYVIQLLKDLKLKKPEDLSKLDIPFDKNNNYQRAVRYGDASLKSFLNDALEYTKVNQEEKRKEALYAEAAGLMNKAQTVGSFQKAISALQPIAGYRDADDLIRECNRRIDELNAAAKKKAEARKKTAKTVSIFVVLTVILSLAAVAYLKIIVPAQKYKAAVTAYENGEYTEARTAFAELGDYEDSTIYSKFIDYVDQGQYEEAVSYALSLGDTAKAEILLKYPYDKATELATHTDNMIQLSRAVEIYGYLDGYSDSSSKIDELIDQSRTIGYDLLTSDPIGAAEYFEIIPRSKRTIPEQQLINLSAFIDSHPGYSFGYNSSTKTLVVSKAPSSQSYMVGLTVIKCDGYTLYVGRITGAGQGIITHHSGGWVAEPLNTQTSITLYFPE